MTLTDKTKLGQKAAIIYNGKVLILKRSMDATHRPGAWDLPGGNAEWPETSQSITNPHRLDIARELEEETGIKVNPETFTDKNLVHLMTYFDADRQLYAVICGWRVRQLTDFNPDNITLSSEHTELAWIGLAELDNYDFGGPVGAFVKTIILNSLEKE